MKKIKFLLKFGQKEHLKSLIDGKLYCSNAVTFWGIEDQLKIKGQGDVLEAGTKMFAQSMVMQNPDTNEIIGQLGKANALARIEPAKKMPVYCMFAVYEDDCVVDEAGNTIICLSDEKKQTIREHFPNADGVVVISDPDTFLDDIKNTIGTNVKFESVHYFNIDKGILTKNGQTAMDMEYMKYMMQDAPPVKENGMTRYTLYADYAYRVLFCKDVYFKEEQEYRIVLPDDIIESGTIYPVCLSCKYEILDLEEFFEN